MRYLYSSPRKTDGNSCHCPRQLSDTRHIELDEAVAGIEGEVEVVLRPVVMPGPAEALDVFELISAAIPGTRSKEEIADERGSWGDR